MGSRLADHPRSAWALLAMLVLGGCHDAKPIAPPAAADTGPAAQ
jgi:hypothetical protein